MATLNSFYPYIIPHVNGCPEITVDTSLVHLSGAMGIKTLLLLPYNNDWRWMKNISHSPWYRSIHILRQEKLGCWDNVILSVCNHLNKKRP